MKYLLLLLALASCAPSTENKLKARVEEIEKESMKKEGLKVDNMEVINVRYHPCSERDFFMWERTAGNLPSNDMRWHTADTAQKYYYVKYHLKAATDKVKVDEEDAVYLLQSNLVQLKKASFDKR